MFIQATQIGDQGEEAVMINLNRVNFIRKYNEARYQVELEGNEYFITQEIYEKILASQVL